MKKHVHFWCPGPRSSVGLAGIVALISCENLAAQNQAVALEEVVVTARLREESAQDIGQSIRAFGQREMERAGIVDFGDIARRTAGMDFTTRGPNANEVSMRGVAKLVNGAILDILGTLPLVSQFVDDVPVIAASSRQRDFNTFDFDRVEILKGPQPTYFGEGSVGGTVRYFSARPTLESGLSGKVNANLSTTEDGGDNHTLNGAMDLTLIPDKLGARLVGFTRDDDGFIDNELTGQEDYNDYRSDGGRLVVLALPTDELRIQFSAHVANDDHGGDWIADVAASNPKFSQRPLDEEWQDDYELYNLTLEYDFGPVRVTSITGYYERELSYSRYDFVQALNSLPVLFGIQGDVVTRTYTRDENLTQELRLVSDLQGPLNFVAGLFYKDADSFNSSSAVSPQIEALNANFLALTGSGAQPNGLFFGSEIVGDPANREQLAVFGELTFEVSDRLRLIGGARWLNEDLVSPVQNPATQNDPALAVCALAADFTPNVSFPNNPCIASTVISNAVLTGAVGLQDLFEVENSMNGEWLPKAAVEFDLRQDVLLYASASKAIRNGGLNSSFVVAQAAEIDNDNIGYDPDEMWAYEAGVKSQWLDNTLVLNGSVYYNEWSNIQTLISTSAGNLFENAGEAVSTGFELEGFWQVNDWLSLTSAFNYTKSEFKDRQVWETPESLAISQLLGRPPNIINDGNQLPNVPEYSLSLAVDVVYPTALPGIDCTGHLDYQWIDERYQDSVNDPALLLSDYALSNLRLGLQSENWSVVGYVSNLTNEISPQSILRVGPGGSTRAAYLNRPRTWGLNLTYSF